VNLVLDYLSKYKKIPENHLGYLKNLKNFTLMV